MTRRRLEREALEKRLRGPDWSSRGAPDPGSRETWSSVDTLFACVAIVIFVGGAVAVTTSERAAPLRQAVWAMLPGALVDNYRSRVADTCDVGWKDNRFNRDQIHCYMTRHVERLCDPRERRALARKLVDYQAAMDRADVRMNAAAFGMIGNLGAVSQMGMSEAASRDPNLSATERAAQFNKTLQMSQNLMSPVDQVAQDNVNTATKADLVADVRSLVEQGYLAASDFPYSQPKIIQEGLASSRPLGGLSCP